jgi:hypothetical protein
MEHVRYFSPILSESLLGGRGGQTPPQPPFYQCIIKAVGFFTVGKPIKPSKTTLPFSQRPRKSSRLNDAYT